jgi:mannose-6-phosphate isomerase-like protein (cupin superfamily)
MSRPYMLIKDTNRIQAFSATDGCRIKEIFHPKNGQVSENISLALAEVAPGEATQPHKLSMLEIYYILEGKGLMHIGDETAEVHSGQAVYIPPLEIQYIENIAHEPLRFLCICRPEYDPDQDELVQRDA